MEGTSWWAPGQHELEVLKASGTKMPAPALMVVPAASPSAGDLDTVPGTGTQGAGDAFGTLRSQQGAERFFWAPTPLARQQLPPGSCPRRCSPVGRCRDEPRSIPGGAAQPGAGCPQRAVVQWGRFVPHLSAHGSNPSRAQSFGDAPSPCPPSSPSPPPPRSSVGSVKEGLVGLQLGGRKERKANQRREDDPVFPHSAPSAPGTTGCPSTAVPRLPGTAVPPPWQHGPIQTHCHPCPQGATWAVFRPWCITSHQAGSLQGSLGPPCFCPHPTGTPDERGQLSAVRGEPFAPLA